MTQTNPQRTAQHARMTLHIAGERISVQHVTAIEGINQPLFVDVGFHTTRQYQRDELIDQTVYLTIQAIDGHHRILIGKIERVDIDYAADRGKHIQLRFTSTLCRGHYQPRSRLFVQQDRQTIVRQLLDEMGYERHEINWRVQGNSPMPTPVLQAQESNFAFFQRLLSEAGWLYWPSVSEQQTAPHELLVITDQPYFPELDIPTLDVPRRQGETAAPHINRLVDCQRTWAQTPKGSLRTRITSGQRPTAQHIGSNTPDWETFCPPLNDAATQHRLRLEHHLLTGQHQKIHIVSHQPRLCVGTHIDLNANARFPEASGQYTIVRVEHHGKQPNSDGQPGVVTYRNDTTLSHVEQRLYPAPADPLLDLPLMFPATIESKSPHVAQLDRDGRYYLRAAFDGMRTQPAPVAEASPAIEVMMPYASPQGSKGRPVGWHFPLLNQSTVLVGCLNGDPNRPVILGFTPNRLALGPVTSNNGKQYRLLTPSQHELTFDDTPANPCIILQTFNGDIRLSLSAQQAEPYLKLATEYGAINMGVAQDLRLKAIAGNLEERVGGQRTVQVKGNSTTTVAGTVHHQAAGNLALHAHNDLSLNADGDLHLRSQGNVTLLNQGNIQTLASQGYQLTLPNGGWLSRINGQLKVHSDSEILLTQGDAGVRITPDKVHIFGKKVTLQGSKGGVSLNGEVQYETGAGNEPVPAPTLKAVEVPIINPLTPTPPEPEVPEPSDRRAQLVDQRGIALANVEYLVVCRKTGQKITGTTDDEGLTQLTESELAAENVTLYIFKEPQNA